MATPFHTCLDDGFRKSALKIVLVDWNRCALKKPNVVGGGQIRNVVKQRYFCNKLEKKTIKSIKESKTERLNQIKIHS